MEVIRMYNDMAEEYGDIRDLWYAWLFSRIHYLIARYLIDRYEPGSVLDVGCGTGFQSFIHAKCGAQVTGIDISDGLIRIAKKQASINSKKEIAAFPAHFGFVEKYNAQIHDILNKRISVSEYSAPRFIVSDARRLPFKSQIFDHVNCVGSVLSYVKEHWVALEDITRVLRPGGTLFLEVEARWNPDLFWALFDVVTKGRLHYDCTAREALKAIFSPPMEYVTVEFQFTQSDKEVPMKLKLFTGKRLRRELSKMGLDVLSTWTIHSLTNIIPSTYLDTPNPPELLRRLFGILASIEESLPFQLPGCSIVFLARKLG